MKQPKDNAPAASCDIKSTARIKDALSRKFQNLRKNTYTCPFCKEICTGLAAFGAHLRDHCR
jgi:hypothetical protein